MSNLRDLLDSLGTFGGGGGGGNATFWRPKKSGKYPMRLYRFLDGPNQDEPTLYAESFIHFLPQGGPPIPCMAPTQECPACKAADSYEAAGDDDSKDKAKRMRRQRRMTFSMVLITEPNGFKLYEATEAVGRNILIACAKAGGYMGKWPREDEMDEFFTCLQKGIPNVCGPAGKDVYLTYDKDADPKNMYTVDLNPFECKVQPFPEDTTVPNPYAVRRRIDQARAAKAAKNQQG